MAKIIDLLFNSYFTPFLVIGLIVLAIFLFRRVRWLFRRLIIPMVIMILLASPGTVNAASRTFMTPAQKFMQAVKPTANIDNVTDTLTEENVVPIESSEASNSEDITAAELTSGLGSIISGENFNHLINLELDEINLSGIKPLADKLEIKRKSMSERLTEKVLNSDFVKEIEQMCKDAMNDPAILYGGQDLSKYE